jgi:hypothetical protein
MGGGGQWWAEAGGSKVRQVEVAESRMTKRSNGIGLSKFGFHFVALALELGLQSKFGFDPNWTFQ